MSSSRLTVFLVNVLVIWAVMHLYVFWRLASIPWVAAHLPRRALVVAGVLLWASYPLARMLSAWGPEAAAWPVEFVAANWIGVLFLVVVAMLAADLVTLGGWLLPRQAPAIRGWALAAAGLLAIVGLVQGLRPPIVREYEVPLVGLPREHDGLVLVAVTDAHLGTLLGHRWIRRLVGRVNAMHPNLVLVVGDLVDGNLGRVEELLPVLKELRAPLGVWSVTGNHEYYAGPERSVALFQQAGYQVLRDRSAQVVPGLVLAGVDDLTARRQFGQSDDAVAKALADRPPGATILLSHSPWQADRAAAAGAGLMLSGHTHAGQIWPFSYLVGLRYPLLAGRYDVGAMPVIVSRGAGTWGPRIRLWRPAEIVRIVLRSKE